MKTKLYVITAVLASGLTLAWLLLGIHILRAQAAPQDTIGVIYVDADATGAGTGLSWIDAYTRVQDALTVAIPGSEIWVAEGVYTPTDGITRAVTFQLKDGVALYGGFAGGEATLDQRDWQAHITVLSGDLDGNDATDVHGVVTRTADIIGANVWTVVTGNGVTETAVLDGFTITAGQANGSDGYWWEPHRSGGGMYNQGGSPTVHNVIFSANYAESGGGMSNRASSPQLINVTFHANAADWDGGGMHNSDLSSPTLTGVTFSANSAGAYGGGMYNYFSSAPSLTDVTFSTNSAGYGGGMYNYYDSDPTLTDVTFSANSAVYGGGMNNSYFSDPTLTDVTFSANTATDGGGGMHNSGSDPQLINCTLQDNTTSGDGGGVYLYSGEMVLTGTQVLSNSASSCGGGVYVSQSNATLAVGSGEISNNSSAAGSAVCQRGGTIDTTTPLTISGQVYQAGGTFDASSYDLRIEGSLVITGSGALFDAPADFDLAGPFIHTAGTYHQIRDVAGSGDVGFPKAGGVIVNAGSYGDLGDTEVTIRAGADCPAVEGEAVQHCYNISPTATSGVSTTLTFYFWNSEIPAGQTCGTQEVWHWKAGWGSALALDITYGTGGHDCSAEPYSIRVKDVTSFSPFVLKEGSPSAIVVQSVADQGGAPIYLVVGAIVTLSGVAAMALHRRRGTDQAFA